jgi:phosphoglycerol transferase MdoB-like AlkP superfamily enzyme
MNKFLANAMGVLNGFIALMIVATALAFGLLVYGTVAIVILSLVIGILIAVLVCGLIAMFSDIREEVIKTKLLVDKKRFED